MISETRETISWNCPKKVDKLIILLRVRQPTERSRDIVAAAKRVGKGRLAVLADAEVFWNGLENIKGKGRKIGSTPAVVPLGCPACGQGKGKNVNRNIERSLAAILFDAATEIKRSYE